MAEYIKKKTFLMKLIGTVIDILCRILILAV